MTNMTRRDLHAAVVSQIRRFIAGTIIFNQRVAESVGLNMTDMQCINLIDLFGPVTPGEIGKGTGLTSGGVTVMLDRLEKAGFISRERHPTDRRSVLIKVNPEKIHEMHAPYADISYHLEAILADTPETELSWLIQFLSRVNAVPGRDEQPAVE